LPQVIARRHGFGGAANQVSATLVQMQKRYSMLGTLDSSCA